VNLQDLLAATRSEFPALSDSNCRVTSPADSSYNCIAWAMQDVGKWWWPDPMRQMYWPSELARTQELSAFIEVFAREGYAHPSTEILERGITKVALFAQPTGTPTHAARQLPDGWWTSKLGAAVDIAHELRAVEGPIYGAVTLIFAKRSR
jgi:hypothetical protein